MKHVVGIDLGQVTESTAIVVVEVNVLPDVAWVSEKRHFYTTSKPVFLQTDGTTTTQHPPLFFDVRHVERFKPGTSYPAIVARTKALAAKLTVPILAIDSTGVGHSTIRLFEKAEIQFEVVSITAGDKVVVEDELSRVPKRDLVSTAQVMLQTQRLRIAKGLPLAETLLRELQTFRMVLPARTGSDVPLWREGAQDDLVFALAVALWVADEKVKVPEGACWSM